MNSTRTLTERIDIAERCTELSPDNDWTDCVTCGQRAVLHRMSQQVPFYQSESGFIEDMTPMQVATQMVTMWQEEEHITELEVQEHGSV